MTRAAGQPGAPTDKDRLPHILSFDVEEYFQVEAAAIGGVRPEQWNSFQPRLAPCIDRILQLLADRGASATFFVLGWVARRQQEMVRAIAAAGHEIASHGMGHTMIQRLEPEAFRRDILDSRKLLEDITGGAVVGYRAPTFSITHRTAWAIDILAEVGFRYDSSIFPVRHDRYGVPDAPRFIHCAVGPGGGQIAELPPLTLRLLGRNLPVGGGGYLRLLPVALVDLALGRAEKKRQPGMIYLHPWELDPDQPPLPMSRLNRWRHRVNLARTERKLLHLMERRRFIGAAEVLESVDADMPRHVYGRADGGR